MENNDDKIEFKYYFEMFIIGIGFAFISFFCIFFTIKTLDNIYNLNLFFQENETFSIILTIIFLISIFIFIILPPTITRIIVYFLNYVIISRKKYKELKLKAKLYDNEN